LSSNLLLDCPSDLFTSSFLITILYTFLLSHMHVTYRIHFIPLHSITLIKYTAGSINYEVPHNICSFFPYSCCLLLIG
jgi:hypothetical protein